MPGGIKGHACAFAAGMHTEGELGGWRPAASGEGQRELAKRIEE